MMQDALSLARYFIGSRDIANGKNNGDDDQCTSIRIIGTTVETATCLKAALLQATCM